MVNCPSNVNDSGANDTVNVKNQILKISKRVKNLILWKHDYSKFQTKWDILYTNMGLSNRHFISQPLEQRIITISEINQKQILKQQENYPWKSPLR